jgi:hypothetical protein
MRMVVRELCLLPIEMLCELGNNKNNISGSYD